MASNGITTGKDPTHFAPNDPVTRGESVTFLKHYDDKIVQPALSGLGQTIGGLACDSSQVARWDGASWVCNTVSLATKIGIDSTTLTGAGSNVGWHTPIAISTDGFPIISYLDATNGYQK